MKQNKNFLPNLLFIVISVTFSSINSVIISSTVDLEAKDTHPIPAEHLVRYNGYSVEFLAPPTDWQAQEIPIYKQLNGILQYYVTTKIMNSPIYTSYHQGVLIDPVMQRDVLRILLSIITITSAQTLAFIAHEIVDEDRCARIKRYIRDNSDAQETYYARTKRYIEDEFAELRTQALPFLDTDTVIDQVTLSSIYNMYGTLLCLMANEKRELTRGKTYASYPQNWEKYLPYKLLIPYCGDCTITDMNDSMTADVWWLGWADRSLDVDGLYLDVVEFLEHDIEHLDDQYDETLDKYTHDSIIYHEFITNARKQHKIITAKINTIEDPNKRAVFHAFHFELLHERCVLNLTPYKTKIMLTLYTGPLRATLPITYQAVESVFPSLFIFYGEIPRPDLMTLLVDYASEFFSLIASVTPTLKDYILSPKLIELTKFFSINNLPCYLRLEELAPDNTHLLSFVKDQVYRLYFVKTNGILESWLSAKAALETIKEQLSQDTLTDFCESLRQYGELLCADDCQYEGKELKVRQAIVVSLLEIFND